jgi:hypothetical protein
MTRRGQPTTELVLREEEHQTMRVPGYMMSLGPPREPAESAFDDFIQLLTQAMTYAQSAGEAVIVGVGCCEPPPSPYCLLVETEQQGVPMNTFQAASPPEGS